MVNQLHDDATEVAKFDRLAEKWWDTEGDLRTLHRINAPRLKFIQRQMDLEDKKILDVGCGGGILAESLARAGAQVTGIDMSKPTIEAAKRHSQSVGLNIDYQHISLENFAEQLSTPFDGIVCMELLEHVCQPSSFVSTIAQLVKPSGDVFFSTINRTLKAYAYAILAAEYVFKLLPVKTHDYDKFIRPSELANWLRGAGIELKTMNGFSYNPLTHHADLIPDVDVNYLMHGVLSDLSS